MTGADLARRLAHVPVADVPAIRLLLELQQADITMDSLDGRYEEIDIAVHQLEQQMSIITGIVRRCETLKPIPSRQIPPGF